METLKLKYILEFPHFPTIQKLAFKYLSKNNTSCQVGGTASLYTYNNYKFKVDVNRDENYITLSIISHENEYDICGTILIDQNDGLAAIQTVRRFTECTVPKFNKLDGMGTLILSFVLHIIDRYKDKLRIKRILLTDNSTRECDNCESKIILADMYFLQYGDTWYGKRGFRPYHEEDKVMTRQLQNYYGKNRDIIKNTLTSDIDLIDVIDNAIKEYNLNIDTNEIFKIIKNNSDQPLRRTITLLNNLSGTCCLFSIIQRDLINKLNMYSFYKHSFYKDLD